MNKSVLLASLLALAGLSSVASAADNNWYVRGDLGSARISVSGLGHDDAFGGAVGVGYYFNPNFAIEGAYTDFGSHHSIRVDAWQLGLAAKTHFDQKQTGFFIDGRLGYSRLEGHSGFGSGSTNKAYFGLGAGYDFSPEFGVSVNYLYNDGGSGIKASLISAGFEARF